MEDQLILERKEATGLTFKDILFKYLRFLPFFVISLALAMLSGYLYLRYTTPTYQSNGALVVKEDNSASGGGGGLGSNDRFQQMFVMDNAINVKNEIEIIRSRQLMKRIVHDLNLNYNYYAKGKIKESNIYSASPFKVETFEIADSNQRFDWKVYFNDDKSFRINDEKKLFAFGETFENDNGIFRLTKNPVSSFNDEYRVEWLPTEIIVDEYGKNLVIAPGGATGVIQIQFEAKNPQLASNLINHLMQEYQVATREDKNETNKRMLEFIDDRLKGVERELDSITGRLLAYQRANNLINPEIQSGGLFSKMEGADEKINEERVQEQVALMIESYLRDGKNTYSLVPSSFSLPDPTLSNLIAAYNVAQLERKSILDSNVPLGNPKVQQLSDQVERLRVNILESVRNLRRTMAASIQNLERTRSRANAEIRMLPIREQEFLEIKTQQETKQTVYNLLLEKREQTAISLAGTISNMKIIEEARPNNVPVKPNHNSTLLISAVIGLALPSLIIFVMELLNDKVNTREDVEKLTSVPIVGEIGHSYDKEQLVVRPNHRGLVAEQFRIIRSNLQYILHNIQKPIILITSSFSGEGKSYVSTNLAAVLALANKKTVVLEFDIRKPKILSHLGIPKKPGIINYLMGKVSLEELPIPVPGYDNLYVIACGPIPPNPSELLLDPQLATLFEYLRKEFDVVIVDTAPIGMVSDAMSLSKFVDTSLYVVRQGYTFKKQITQIDDFHSSGKLPRVSILLNDVRIRAGYGYYGYGRYGYGYGNKSGYFDDEVKSNGKMSKWFGWLDMKKWDKEKV
ncbi:MAG: GumC family protein [Chitinophagaceae bacterium]